MRDIQSLLSNLKFEKFRFHIEPINSIIFPSFKGQTIRGAFGHTLRKLFCVKKELKSCTECLLYGECIYAYIFESPNIVKEPFFLSATSSVPHPFVIEPPLDGKLEYKAGENFSFDIVLIGKAINYIPYIILVFREIGKKGLGIKRSKFILKSVSGIKGEKEISIYNGDKDILHKDTLNRLFSEESFSFIEKIEKKFNVLTLNFITPVRLIEKKIILKNLEFYNILKSLLIRIALLSFFHCGNKPEIEINSLVEEAKSITVTQSNLKWLEWTHFSPRMKEEVKLGGLIGEVSFKGNFSKWLTILKIGEIIHIGKATSFGFGKYEIKTN